MTGRDLPTLDIIVPVYNEERGIESFHAHLTRVTAPLDVRTTIYYVDDGSTDRTAALLNRIAEHDARVVLLELSRNFGHQAALSAGLDASRGHVVVTMDGDGQHPPELVPDMLKLFDGGYEVVLAQRTSMQDAGLWKRVSSRTFYGLLTRISDTEVRPGCADYRLMSRPVVEQLKRMPEYHRFLRGMVAWLGYRTAILPYAEPRRETGRSKYSVAKMLRLATDAISSFSLVPLRIGIGLGVCFLVFAVLEMIYVLSFWVRGRQHLLVPGWSSLMFVVLLVGGVVMITLGIVGSYIGYIFQEVKRRPVYVVRSIRRSKEADD